PLHADMAFAFMTILTYDPAFKFDWADFDNDGQVTILDVASAALCYGSVSQVGSVACPSTVSWYWDIDTNGKIDIIDIANIAIEYGKTLPQTYPGEGLLPGQLDLFLMSRCNFLTGVELAYCHSR